MTQWPKTMVLQTCMQTNNQKLSQMDVNVFEHLSGQHDSLYILKQNDGFICSRHHNKHSKVVHTWELNHMEIHRQASSPTTSVKWHPCSSIWQTHTCRFPMWRISLSVWVVNVEKQSTPHWYAEACAQTGSVLLLGCAERRSGTALRMSAKLSNTHTHSPQPQVCPGPGG